MPNSSQQFLGWLRGKKIGGNGVLAVGTEITIPFLSAEILDPLNNSYVPTVNKAASVVNVVQGMATPSLSFNTVAKASWFTPNILNSWMMAFDANNDGDEWAWQVNDGRSSGTLATRVLDGSRGVAMSLTQSAMGGGLGVSIAFIAKSAQGSTTFSGAAVDPGRDIDRSNIDFGAGPSADMVTGYTINVVRGGAYESYFNGTYLPAATASGMIGGSIELSQMPKYTTTPSTSATLRVYTGPLLTTLLMTGTFAVNFDQVLYPYSPGMGQFRRQYTLIDLAGGAIPITFA